DWPRPVAAARGAPLILRVGTPVWVDPVRPLPDAGPFVHDGLLYPASCVLPLCSLGSSFRLATSTHLLRSNALTANVVLASSIRLWKSTDFSHIQPQRNGLTAMAYASDPPRI